MPSVNSCPLWIDGINKKNYKSCKAILNLGGGRDGVVDPGYCSTPSQNVVGLIPISTAYL